MKNKKTPPRLNGPIPGQSLTTEPGNRPWEKPPRITGVDEAINFYVDKLTEPKTSAMIMDKVEEGMPLTLLADTFQTLSVAKGIHSLDTGVIVAPVIIELLKAMAEDMDVNYTIGTEDDANSRSAEDEEMAEDVAATLLRTSGGPSKDMDTEEDIDLTDEKEPEPKRRGLMARKMETTEDGI